MDIRQKLNHLIEQHNPPTDLAKVSRAIGKNHAYLQQFIRRGVPRTLPEAVRYALAEFLGVHHTELMDDAVALKQQGMEESPGIPFQHAPRTLLQSVSGAPKQIIRKGDTYYISGIETESDKMFALEVKDRSLNLSGFLPGDVVISDLDAPTGDARFVIAQHYLDDDGDAETLIRIWQRPYLMPHSTDPGFRPLHVEDDNIRIVSPILKKMTLF